MGGDTARSLGMWSSARELAEKRADAAAKRKGRLAGEGKGPAAAGDAGADAGGLVAETAWQPLRDPALGRRPDDAVPRLRDLCVDLVVEYIEDVETLYGLPDGIKVRSSGVWTGV